MIRTCLSSDEGLPVECSNDVSSVVSFPSVQVRSSSPALIQQPAQRVTKMRRRAQIGSAIDGREAKNAAHRPTHSPSGILRPRWLVSMKLRPSVCGATPLPGACRAKHTPRTASGMSSSFSNSYVRGNAAQFSTFHTPSRLRRTADQPVPITLFCHAESPENSALLRSSASSLAACRRLSSSSSAMTLDRDSSSAAHGKRAASAAASQNGLAVRPSTCSSDGWWPGAAGSGGGRSPRALDSRCVVVASLIVRSHIVGSVHRMFVGRAPLRSGATSQRIGAIASPQSERADARYVLALAFVEFFDVDQAIFVAMPMHE